MIMYDYECFEYHYLNAYKERALASCVVWALLLKQAVNLQVCVLWHG